LLTAGFQLKHTENQGKRYANASGSYSGLQRAANEQRVDTMRQGGNFAGHMTPMIAKKLVEGSSGKAVDMGKAGIRSKEEYQNQF
jgi:hypothetical protein